MKENKDMHDEDIDIDIAIAIDAIRARSVSTFHAAIAAAIPHALSGCGKARLLPIGRIALHHRDARVSDDMISEEDVASSERYGMGRGRDTRWAIATLNIWLASGYIYLLEDTEQRRRVVPEPRIYRSIYRAIGYTEEEADIASSPKGYRRLYLYVDGNIVSLNYIIDRFKYIRSRSSSRSTYVPPGDDFNTVALWEVEDMLSNSISPVPHMRALCDAYGLHIDSGCRYTPNK
jgi:hypothetical protein